MLSGSYQIIPYRCPSSSVFTLLPLRGPGMTGSRMFHGCLDQAIEPQHGTTRPDNSADRCLIVFVPACLSTVLSTAPPDPTGIQCLLLQGCEPFGPTSPSFVAKQRRTALHIFSRFILRRLNALATLLGWRAAAHSLNSLSCFAVPQAANRAVRRLPESVFAKPLPAQAVRC